MIEPALPKAYLITFHEERTATPFVDGIRIRARCYSISHPELDQVTRYTATETIFDDKHREYFKVPVGLVMADERGRMARDMIEHASKEEPEYNRCILMPTAKWEQLMALATSAHRFARLWKRLAKTYFTRRTEGGDEATAPQ